MRSEEYVMFQKVTLWPDHKSWKDLNSIAADPTLSGAVPIYLMLENVALVKSFPPMRKMNNKKMNKKKLENSTNLTYPCFRTWSKS